jgi:hypothetical protein
MSTDTSLLVLRSGPQLVAEQFVKALGIAVDTDSMWDTPMRTARACVDLLSRAPSIRRPFPNTRATTRSSSPATYRSGPCAGITYCPSSASATWATCPETGSAAYPSSNTSPLGRKFKSSSQNRSRTGCSTDSRPGQRGDRGRTFVYDPARGTGPRIEHRHLEHARNAAGRHAFASRVLRPYPTTMNFDRPAIAMTRKLLRNDYINRETIRVDGGVRLAPCRGGDPWPD